MTFFHFLVGLSLYSLAFLVHKNARQESGGCEPQPPMVRRDLDAHFCIQKYIYNGILRGGAWRLKGDLVYMHWQDWGIDQHNKFKKIKKIKKRYKKDTFLKENVSFLTLS